MRIAWFNPFAGIAGDMALGALVDAGADLAEIEAACRLLGYPGWELTAARVERAGIVATHVQVEVAEQHHHRRAGDIIDTIKAAGLAPRATRRAEATFALLAVAEGRLHGVAPPDVHFHEVGAVDSIIDIVGTAVALELLGIDQVTSAPVAVGVGTVKAAHGTLPNPAPAVLRVLEGAPIRGVDVDMELTTPTGAALLGALAERYGAAPTFELQASGYGAGTRNPPGRPNVVQVVIGTSYDAERTPAGFPLDPATLTPAALAPVGTTDAQTVTCLETNLDDVTAEQLGHTVERLLEAGALDAWCTPATMKKSRSGVVLSVLCPVEAAPSLTLLVARETGTLGIRQRLVERWVAPRRLVEVLVDGRPVRVKVGPYGAKPEYDDVAALARRTGRSYREAARAADQAAQAAGFVPTGSDPEDSRAHNER